MSRRGPTSVPISEQLYRELREVGFISFCRDDGGRVLIFDTPTIRHLPPAGPEEEDREQPPVERLEYVLAASRMAQYLRCTVREKKNSFRSVEECEKYLNAFVAKYTCPAGDPGSAVIKAQIRVVESETPSGRSSHIEGDILPNLRRGFWREPLHIEIPIVLPESLPLTGDPYVPASVGPDDRVSGPDPAVASSLKWACESLERVAELKAKQLIEESESQEIRKLLVGELKRACLPSQFPATASTPELPYGQMHSSIVEKIAARYRSAGDQKQRAYRAVAEMAENEALHPGDSELLCCPI